jgi:hypothetical protein
MLSFAASASHREDKSLELDNVMPVTEEPYITDLDLESHLHDVTDNTLELVTELTQPASSWMPNAPSTNGQVDWTTSESLYDGQYGNVTTGFADFTLPVTELTTEKALKEQADQLNISGRDFTSDSQELLTGWTPSDLLANGLNLLNDQPDHTDNVNEIFEHQITTRMKEITEDMTQNALHLFVTMPHNNAEGKDHTDNVFKMLFHSDELDGLLELENEVGVDHRKRSI